LPPDLIFFKAQRWQTSAWPFIESILKKEEQVFIDNDIPVSFADFKYVNSAFLTSFEYGGEYPKELRDKILNYPSLFLAGTFENASRVSEKNGSNVRKAFETGKYSYPTLPDASRHLIDIGVDINYQWGALYLVLRIPIKIEASAVDGQLRCKFEIPSNLRKLPTDAICVISSTKGERFEALPMNYVSERENIRILSSSLTLKAGERAKEIFLRIADKRVASTILEELQPLSTSSAMALKVSPTMSSKQGIGKKRVWVVHGRNNKARDAMFNFLRAIGLDPIEWSEAIKLTGKCSPYIGQILDVAFEKAQAVVVLLTGDDLARLQYKYKEPQEVREKLTPQARPNVIFESGMAFGKSEERTILVQLGEIREISDLAGRHILKINNSPERRQDLVSRLKSAGCDVQIDGKTDWLKVGDFEVSIFK